MNNTNVIFFSESYFEAFNAFFEHARYIIMSLVSVVIMTLFPLFFITILVASLCIAYFNILFKTALIVGALGGFILILPYFILAISRIALASIDSSYKESGLSVQGLGRFFVIYYLNIVILLAGLICFIIPGIIWMVRTHFVTYAVIAENASISGAFYRSFELTKNYSWPIFLVSALSIAFARITGGIGFPYISLVNAALYCRLKEKK